MLVSSSHKRLGVKLACNNLSRARGIVLRSDKSREWNSSSKALHFLIKLTEAWHNFKPAAGIIIGLIHTHEFPQTLFEAALFCTLVGNGVNLWLSGSRQQREEEGWERKNERIWILSESGTLELWDAVKECCAPCWWVLECNWVYTLHGGSLFVLCIRKRMIAFFWTE